MTRIANLAPSRRKHWAERRISETLEHQKAKGVANPATQTPLPLLHLRRNCLRAAPAFFTCPTYERAVA